WKCQIDIGRRLEQREERRSPLRRQRLVARGQTIENAYGNVRLRADSLVEVEPYVLTLESLQQRKNSTISIARERAREVGISATQRDLTVGRHELAVAKILRQLVSVRSSRIRIVGVPVSLDHALICRGEHERTVRVEL